MDPLGWAMASLAICGTFGLFLIGLADRLVPILPSYAMLVAIGVAAADGAWSLPFALAAITLGGVLGCAGSLYGMRLIGEARSERVLDGASRLFRVSADRRDRLRRAYRGNQTALAFSLQLVPTVRLFTPILAVLLGGSTRNFLLASTLGIIVWNSLFVGVGYLASRSLEGTNATLLSIAVLACLLTAKIAFLAASSRIKGCRTRSRAPS